MSLSIPYYGYHYFRQNNRKFEIKLSIPYYGYKRNMHIMVCGVVCSFQFHIMDTFNPEAVKNLQLDDDFQFHIMDTPCDTLR